MKNQNMMGKTGRKPKLYFGGPSNTVGQIYHLMGEVLKAL